MTAAARREARLQRKRREMVTPEGIALPITLASRSTRFGALLIDLIIIFAVNIGLSILLRSFALAVFAETGLANRAAVLEFLQVVMILVSFVLLNGYFMFFELGPRGATLGKRLTGIRIAARDGGRLSAEAVIARNLLRDIELFLPLGLVVVWSIMTMMGEGMGSALLAATIWFLVFALFPFFNRDRLRAGDLIAGTWVVEAPKRKLAEAMSLGEGSRGRSVTTGAHYRFGDEELAVYGEYELQTLERVLRENKPDALVTVAETICAKIGWESGVGDERAFLEAFYAQLRARLERDMRFGKRKADKHS